MDIPRNHLLRALARLSLCPPFFREIVLLGPADLLSGSCRCWSQVAEWFLKKEEERQGGTLEGVMQECDKDDLNLVGNGLTNKSASVTYFPAKP